MSEFAASPNEVSERTNGKPLLGQHDWPNFTSLEHSAQTLPLLHMPGAWPVARDRWERLVTTIHIPASPDDIWHALIEPDALKLWLAVCHGSLEQRDADWMLDFEDGEFFLGRSTIVEPGVQLQYLWRWLGIGQATSVTWRIDGTPGGSQVTVTEEAINPPWDWQTWNGGGWPGILEQLASFLRTGTSWRWPWRRMGPYAQVELPVSIYEAWDRLSSASGLRFWLQVMQGDLLPEQSMTILMGDASGKIEMIPREIVPPGQVAPSFLPYINFSLTRPVWNTELGGRIWIEPAGWGRSICQVVHYNWENLPPELQLPERRIVASFWAGAMRRAMLLCGNPQMDVAPHSWT